MYNKLAQTGEKTGVLSFISTKQSRISFSKYKNQIKKLRPVLKTTGVVIQTANERVYPGDYDKIIDKPELTEAISDLIKIQETVANDTTINTRQKNALQRSIQKAITQNSLDKAIQQLKDMRAQIYTNIEKKTDKTEWELPAIEDSKNHTTQRVKKGSLMEKAILLKKLKDTLFLLQIGDAVKLADGSEIKLDKTTQEIIVLQEPAKKGGSLIKDIDGKITMRMAEFDFGPINVDNSYSDFFNEQILSSAQNFIKFHETLLQKPEERPLPAGHGALLNDQELLAKINRHVATTTGLSGTVRGFSTLFEITDQKKQESVDKNNLSFFGNPFKWIKKIFSSNDLINHTENKNAGKKVVGKKSKGNA